MCARRTAVSVSLDKRWCTSTSSARTKTVGQERKGERKEKKKAKEHGLAHQKHETKKDRQQ